MYFLLIYRNFAHVSLHQFPPDNRRAENLTTYRFHNDELSIQLGSARVGCTVGKMVVNQLMLANDIAYGCSAPALMGCNVL